MIEGSAETYLAEIEATRKTGHAREHTYRPALARYITELGVKALPLNEPKHSEHGAPDFVFTQGDLILGYAETKDIGVDLNKVEKSEQMKRYLGYSNLILTDYLEFRFYKNGSPYGESTRIASVAGEKLAAHPAAFAELDRALKDFFASPPERIRSGKRLAEIMGGKARRIRDNVYRFLTDKADSDTDLLHIYESVKKMLVHDLTLEHFADMYAQTLVYGLFVARHEDKSSGTFSRGEALTLVPASNPFLHQFFSHIAGANFNKRLSYIVDELCDIFRVSEIRELMDEYFKKNGATEGQDPVIHFYEDFLKEYDADLRKKMGAYYTPLPIVRFIVRAVDDVLTKDFGLADGLADTAKLPDGRHKVQVLDPAVGTGTFISAVIRSIYLRLEAQKQLGRWTTYVHRDLLPRIHGFELMMAAYTIAHLKLSIAFKQTGFTIFNKRLGIYLTNSLEQAPTAAPDLFSFGLAQSIAEEAKQAAVIKNETPIMVVLGNPPYSVSSSNKGEWIQNLIKDYKKGLGEKKINLDDDYIKFIRFAEHFIEENGSGIVAMITNNSYIDGITHRQMRKHLLETFDDIYILDLHGSARKKEENDENVFSIQQGVAISIFVRKEKTKQGLGIVHHAELHGTRESKFEALDVASITTVKWTELKYAEPSYFLVPKDFALSGEYEQGFSLTELFVLYGPGTKTERDQICITYDISDLKAIINDFENLSESEITSKYNLYESRDWGVERAKADVLENTSRDLFTNIQYRPFDYRWIWYSGKSKGFVGTPGKKVGQNLLHPNMALVTSRTVYGNYNWNDIFVTKNLVEFGIMATRIGNTAPVLPLYLYTDDGSRAPNLKKEIVDAIEKIVGKTVPEEIFDYIYAALHSPSYREKYKEFLKIDFPRVPYPKDKKQFNALAALGIELRELHLLESPKVRKFITTYPVSGSDTVGKITRKDSDVYINADQYFGGVPETAWDFYIGGYQPAQKWLKDRKGRTLTSDDIGHYQKIIVALVETARVMSAIEKV